MADSVVSPFSHLVAWILIFLVVVLFAGGLFCFVACVLLVSRSFAI